MDNECPVRCEHKGRCVRMRNHKHQHVGYCPVNGPMSVWGDDGKCEGER